MNALGRRLLASRPALLRRAFAAQAGAEHGAHNPDLWKKVTMFVCVPCIAMAMVNTYLSEVEHHKHPRPPFQPYEYLYIRKKRFPWGDGNRSLFHNPQRNALPDGYETEDPVQAHH